MLHKQYEAWMPFHCQKPYLHIMSLKQNSLIYNTEVRLLFFFSAHSHMLHVSSAPPPSPILVRKCSVKKTGTLLLYPNRVMLYNVFIIFFL